MKNFNLLRKSERKSVGTTLALTVGSPSFDRRGTMLKHYAFMLLFLLGSLNVWGEDTWVQVTSAQTDWSGEYLIVYQGTSTTEGVAWTGVDAENCNVAVTISSGVISTKPSTAVSVTIASMTGGYSVVVNGGTYNGKYIKNNGNSNGIKFETTSTVTTFTYENNAVTITCGGKKFRYNNNSGNYRFRYFGSNQQVIQLYKKQSGPANPTDKIASRL